MSSSGTNPTRQSGPPIKKLWVAALIALGVVAVSGGAAVASIASADTDPNSEPTVTESHPHPVLPAPPPITPER
jgi:hypothetical protein